MTTLLYDHPVSTRVAFRSLLKLNADRQFGATLDLGWGKKWGKKPQRSQPIPADLDLAKAA